MMIGIQGNCDNKYSIIKFAKVIIFVLILLGANGAFAVNKYNGIQPGKTDKMGVVKILGKPESKDDNLYKYSSSDDNTESVTVEFVEAKGKLIADEIVVTFEKPIRKNVVVEGLKLSPSPLVNKVNDKEVFEEYYGSEDSLIIIYSGKTEKSGVKKIAYLSKKRFDYVTIKITGKHSGADKTKSITKGEDSNKISLEAKQHLQQGMILVSLAKSNPKNKDENYNNALLEFSNAIKIEPNYEEAYSNRAVIYMLQEKYNKAEKDLLIAAEINPEDPYVQYNLAALYSLQNKTDLALDAMDNALKNGFNNMDALKPSGKGSDPDLRNLRKDPGYKKVLEKNKVFILK